MMGLTPRLSGRSIDAATTGRWFQFVTNVSLAIPAFPWLVVKVVICVKSRMNEPECMVPGDVVYAQMAIKNRMRNVLRLSHDQGITFQR